MNRRLTHSRPQAPGSGSQDRPARCWSLLLRLLAVLLLCPPSLLPAQNLAPPGRSLTLVEKGSYLELPPDVFNDFTEATVEAWVKWNAFGNRYQRIFNYGEGGRDLSLTTRTASNTLWFAIADPAKGLQLVAAPEGLRAGEWVHIAGVSGREGMRLYVNGVLVGSNPYSGSFSSLGGGKFHRLGQTVTGGVDDTPFDGELAEVRVWKTARTVEQIRENIAKKLTGGEPGLVGLWNFDDPANPGRDASPNHHDGKMIGSARAMTAEQALLESKGRSALALPGNQGVLDLDGNGSYVELPPNIFYELTEATVEGWVQWREFRGDSRFFDFGKQWQGINAGAPTLGETAGTLRIQFYEAGRIEHHVGAAGVLRANEWVHVAAVFGSGGAKLYLNGTLVASDPFTGSGLPAPSVSTPEMVTMEALPGAVAGELSAGTTRALPINFPS